MPKKQPNKKSPRKKRGLSIKQKKLKNKLDYAYKKRKKLRVEAESLISSHVSKLKNKKLNRLINEAGKLSKEIALLKARKSRFKKKKQVKKIINKTPVIIKGTEKPLKLDYSAWDRKEIFAHIQEKQIRVCVNLDTSEYFMKRTQLPNIYADIIHELTHMGSEDIFTLLKYSNAINYYVKRKEY